MMMTEEQLIARQAYQIEELRDEVEDLKTRIRTASLHIHCIGGPLNDNRQGYTRDQLITFHLIESALGAA